MPGREVVGPSAKNFVWPPHALPSFGWWTFDCGRMPDGGLLDVVSQARPSIEAHLLPVRLARRQAVGWPQRLQSNVRQRLNGLGRRSSRAAWRALINCSVNWRSRVLVWVLAGFVVVRQPCRDAGRSRKPSGRAHS